MSGCDGGLVHSCNGDRWQLLAVWQGWRPLATAGDLVTRAGDLVIVGPPHDRTHTEAETGAQETMHDGGELSELSEVSWGLRIPCEVQDLVRNWSRDHCLLALVQDHPVE